ncbi:MAG: hypothetical protein PHV37_01215 [Candidatus Gastranaerophilales bacterium]|nr:hypothetical protein [Candidatus Gastranaerophilales bacterium]
MAIIPICPLMSAGNDIEIVCAQEKCAWYIKNFKTCSVYLLGHNAVLDIKEKQAASKKSK